MFLAIDIGNSSVKMGVHDGNSWAWIGRSPHERNAIRSELVSIAKSHNISQVGIASVVPASTQQVVKEIEAHIPVQPFCIGPDTLLPFSVAYTTAETLGADRLAAVAGASALFRTEEARRSIVVVDAGTAVTLEVLTAENVYVGGSIAPGPDLLQFALTRGTAQLPVVSWKKPDSAIGSSTSEAIQAGLVITFVEGIRALLKATVKQLTDVPHVVATGGWGPWLAESILDINQVEPHLVLDGIRHLVQFQTRSLSDLGAVTR